MNRWSDTTEQFSITCKSCLKASPDQPSFTDITLALTKIHSASQKQGDFRGFCFTMITPTVLFAKPPKNSLIWANRGIWRTCQTKFARKTKKTIVAFVAFEGQWWPKHRQNKKELVWLFIGIIFPLKYRHISSVSLGRLSLRPLSRLWSTPQTTTLTSTNLTSSLLPLPYYFPIIP